MRTCPASSDYDPKGDPVHRAQHAQNVTPGIRQAAEQRVDQGIQHLPLAVQARMQVVDRILTASNAAPGGLIRGIRTYFSASARDRLSVLRGELSTRFLGNARDLLDETAFEHPYAPVRELWQSVRRAFSAPRNVAMTMLEQEQRTATETIERHVRDVVDRDMAQRRADYERLSAEARTLRAQLQAVTGRITQLETKRALLLQRPGGPGQQIDAQLQQERQLHVQLTGQLEDVSRDLYDIAEEVRASDSGARTAVEDMHEELAQVISGSVAVADAQLRRQFNEALERDTRAERTTLEDLQREADAWMQTQKTQGLPTSPLPFALRRNLKKAKDDLNVRTREIMARFGPAFSLQQQVADRLLFRADLLAPTGQMPMQFGGQPGPLVNVVLDPNPAGPNIPPAIPGLSPVVRQRAQQAITDDRAAAGNWLAVFPQPQQQPQQPPPPWPWTSAQERARAENAINVQLGAGTYEASEAIADFVKAEEYLRNNATRFLPILAIAEDNEADYVQRLAYELHVYLHMSPGRAARPLYVEQLSPGYLAAAALFSSRGKIFEREHERRSVEARFMNQLLHPLSLTVPNNPFRRKTLEADLDAQVAQGTPAGKKQVYGAYCSTLIQELEDILTRPQNAVQLVYPMEGLTLLYDAIERAIPDVEQFSVRSRAPQGGNAIQPGAIPVFGDQQMFLSREAAVVSAWIARARRLREEYIRLNLINVGTMQRNQLTVLQGAEERITSWVSMTNRNLS